MDWGEFLGNLFSAFVGALALLTAQKLEARRVTWTCPKCEPPLKFAVSSEDKVSRKQVADHHLRTVHSQ